MRLKAVKLTHFRGYSATTVIPIDEAMTGIDYGKSTILEALDTFLETEMPRPTRAIVQVEASWAASGAWLIEA